MSTFYRYEVYHNCNLTEIGEPFAEQPYALAVQQGSHLQEELSRAILELQKDRRAANKNLQSVSNQSCELSNAMRSPFVEIREVVHVNSSNFP